MKSNDQAVRDMYALAKAHPENWPTYYRMQGAAWRKANPDRAREMARDKQRRYRARQKARMAELEARVAALDAGVNDLLGSAP